MIPKMLGIGLTLMLAMSASKSTLEKGAKALADFRPEAAVELLEEAKKEGPYNHADHVRLYEQLGIAYAYLERSDDAVEAFAIMLALEPTAAISYTLSPKVTFLFERAREQKGKGAAPSIDLSWPRDLRVDESVPVDVEVLSDPKGFLKKARLFHRVRGAARFSEKTLPLPKAGGRAELELSAPAPNSKQSEVMELFLVGYDDRGNEVLRWGDEASPRELSLRYEPPDPWYGKWWIWVAAGAAVAASAGAAVFVVTREPGPTVGGTFGVTTP